MQWIMTMKSPGTWSRERVLFKAMAKLKEEIGVFCLWQWTAYDAETSEQLWQTCWHKNLITQGGLNFLAAVFANQETNDVPKFLVMGTGTTPANIADTALQTEGFRKAVTRQSRDAGMARIRFFLLASEANGNWSEWGVIIKGTALSGGTLFNRVLPLGGISKASNTVLSVELRLSFTAG